MPQQMPDQAQGLPNLLSRLLPTTLTSKSTPQTIQRQNQEQDRQTPTQSPENKLTNSYSQDLIQSKLAKVTDPKLNRNPLFFTDPTDKQAAILARAQHIIKSPQYEALAPEKRTEMMGRYYDKYVAPGYVEKGFNAPDKNNWVSQIDKHAFNLHPEDYYSSSTENNLRRFGFGIIDSWGKTFNSLGQAMSSQLMVGAILGDKIFDSSTPAPQRAKATEETYKKLVADMSNDLPEASTFWFNTHPTKAWQAHMMSGAGNLLATLPIYEALGAGRIATLGRIPESLTAGLKTSKIGIQVATTLGEAADSFFGSLLEGDSPKESGVAAAQWAAMAGTARLGKYGGSSLLKWAGTGTIKKFSSLVGTQGGHVLQNVLTDEAHNYLTGIKKLNENDPLKAKLIQAEGHILDSMAYSTHGSDYKALTPEQKELLLLERNILHAKGIAEVSIHAPEETKKVITESLQNDIQTTPQLGVRVKELKEKFNIDVADALHEAEVEKVAKTTGIQSQQDTLKKASKVVKSSKIKSDVDIDLTKGVKKSEKSVRAYAQFKVDSLAYMTNRTKKVVKNLKGAAADSTLTKYLADMETSDFMAEINDQTGNAIKFESPYHQLLWANQYRSQLPKPFVNKIKLELKELDPGGNYPKWDTQADNLSTHLGELAYTGRLWSDFRGVFKSTQVDSMLSKTKWQLQLRKEVEMQELNSMLVALKKYPKAAKQTVSTLKVLQRERAKVESSKEYNKLAAKIRSLPEEVLKKEMN